MHQLSWNGRTKKNSSVLKSQLPHNIAGLATAASICQRWNGEQIDEFTVLKLATEQCPPYSYCRHRGVRLSFTWLTVIVMTLDIRKIQRQQEPKKGTVKNWARISFGGKIE